MLRKLLFIFVFMFPVLFFLAGPALALYPYPSPDLAFGHNQYYTVHLRGNGEAVVSVKDIFTNSDETPLSFLRFTFSGDIQPRDVRAYQVIQNRICLRYRSPTPTPTLPPQIPIGIPQQGQSESILPQPIPPLREVCEEYQQPDYTTFSYGRAQYKQAEASVAGNVLTVTLPESVPSSSSGSILLVYRAFGYVERNVFGTFSYTFTTPTISDEVSQLQVGITTDSDYQLKGARGNVDYNESVAALSLPTVDSGAGARSQQLDSVYYRIGQGNVIKTASNLAANESYTVNGAYAQSLWKLYVKEILLGLFLLQVGIVLVIVVGKKIWRQYHQTSLNKVSGQTRPLSASHFISEQKPFIVTLIVSFLAALLALLYTAMLYLITNVLDNTLHHYQFEIVIIIVMILISFCVYAAVIVGPAVYIGMKRGVAWGVVTLGMIAGWLLLFLLTAILVLFSTIQVRPLNREISPMPMSSPASPGIAVPDAEERF